MIASLFCATAAPGQFNLNWTALLINNSPYEYHDNTRYDLRIMVAHDLTGDNEYDWGIGRGRNYLRGAEPPNFPPPSLANVG